jgi:hypothetical protein
VHVRKLRGAEGLDVMIPVRQRRACIASEATQENDCSFMRMEVVVQSLRNCCADCTIGGMHGRPRRWMAAVFAVIPSLVLLGGCIDRDQGDVGGIPITINAHLELGFLNGMRNNQDTFNTAMERSPPGHYVAFYGLFVAYYSIEVELIAYDAHTHAEVFHQDLYWDDNSFMVPLIPGHSLVLKIKAWGGREGTENLGLLTVPAASSPTISLRLTESNATVICGTPPWAPLPAPAHSP